MKIKSFMLKFMLVSTFIVLSLFSRNTTVEASEEYNLDSETQQMLEEAIQINPAIQDYIDSTVQMFNEEQNVTNEELNAIIIESLENSMEISRETNADLERELDQIQIEEANSLNQEFDDSTSEETQTMPNPIVDATTAYRLGISIVRGVGHNQTANYMEHAIVPTGESADSWTPSPYISHNDDWARRVATHDGLNMNFFCRV